MAQGKFITLEGGEGVGKSTCLATVLGELQRCGIDVVATREPGGTALGESLRRVLLDAELGSISGDAELLLVFSARAEHIVRVIKPALRAGQWVISDRFTDATYAYQGGGRFIDMERIAVIEQWVQEGLQPDLTLLLDAPIEVGLRRVAQRGAPDRFEREEQIFFENVRQAYLQRACRYPQRFRIIDADADIDIVQAGVRRCIRKLLSGDSTVKT